MSLNLFFFIALALSLPSLAQASTYGKTFSLMLDPAGDAKYPGREIDDAFERGVTLQYAKKVKYELETTFPDMRVIITRVPGESTEPLQNAQFANRLQVDLYVHISFFKATEEKPQLFVWYYVHNGITDFWHKPSNAYTLIPYDKAHLKKIATTQQWGTSIQEILSQNNYRNQFEVMGFYGTRYKPLVGIVGPALGIEASIKNKDDWHMYVQPLVCALGSIISRYRTQQDI
jgi:N-acetylmuramoyl-L-alanine amidase